MGPGEHPASPATRPKRATQEIPFNARAMLSKACQSGPEIHVDSMNYNIILIPG